MYFEQLTEMHLNYPKTASTTLYAAPIVFDRNAHIVPALVRIADIQVSLFSYYFSVLFHESSEPGSSSLGIHLCRVSAPEIAPSFGLCLPKWLFTMLIR
jgi:hypothetical protein